MCCKLTLLFVGAALFATTPVVVGQSIPAFPGAEGAGSLATGGRPKLILGQLQGEVYHVTMLAADPNGTIPGSLRYGMRDDNFQVPAIPGIPVIPDVPGTYDIKPRIIVFDVGGTIVLNNMAPNSDIDITPRNFTLAGQTAPGGITIYGGEFNPGHREAWDTNGTPSPTNNLIIRNLSVRTHNANEKDAFWVPLSNSIVDHVSASWYTDEGVSITDGARDITVQHSIVGPGWNSPDGDGSQIEGRTPMADISVHHNLYLHNDARIPRVGEKTQTTGGPGVELDFRNNVVYNWNDSRIGYGVSGENSFSNFVNNYYIGGAGSSSTVILNVPTGGAGQTHRVYQSGNLMDQNKNGSADGSDLSWNAFTGNEAQQVVPYSVPHGITQTPADALDVVRQYAGANWWNRHFLDQRAINQLATFGNSSLPLSERGQVLGAVPADDVSTVVNSPMQTRPAGYDTDNDGMPDEWERSHELNPISPAGSPDWNLDYDNDGYINVEEFINELGEWPAPADIVFTGGTNTRFEQITNWSITRSSPGEADTTTHWQPSRFDVAVINSGTVTLDSVGQHAGTIRLGSTAGNNATFNITAGWLQVKDEAQGPGNGQVIIGAVPAATAAINLSGGKFTAKTISMGSGGAFNFTGGVLSAETIDFDLVNDGGTLAPGNSPGNTTINSSFTVNTGALEMELSATESFDTVTVAGSALLGGSLHVRLLDGFMPANNDVFTILTGQSISGSFANLAPDGRVTVEGGGSFLVTVSGSHLDLSDFLPPGLAGDYNNNGVVDAADYVVWRRSLASNTQLMNETASPGVVDFADYVAWRATFGATAGQGNNTRAVVPEPCVALLVIIGSWFDFFGLRRPVERMRRYLKLDE